MRIYFATGNINKVREVQEILTESFKVLSLIDLRYLPKLEETWDTLEENSRLKAKTLFDYVKAPCFADDTGLEVLALGGAPGVRSARYAEKESNDLKNVDLLLHNLRNESNRKARFRTVITLFIEGNENQFEGIVDGKITTKRRGSGGFGYDPVFVPDGYVTTFAEMAPEEKNMISHRGKSITKLVDFLKEQFHEL